MFLIEGELSVEALDAQKKTALDKFQQIVAIDGFRKGHIPENKLIEHVGALALLEEQGSLALEASYEEIIKEACDVIVVTLGLLLSMGIDVNKAWELVHKNNMSKVSNQDTIVKDENGKIMKSPESKARKAKMMEDIKELLSGSLH